MAAASGGEDDSMVCLICMEVFKKPKFLPCFHTFCASCIQDWSNQHRIKSRPSFPCPACRKETSLPRGGVDKLQTNFYLSQQTLEKTRAGKLCCFHRNQELDLFCVQCQKVICVKCKVLHHDVHIVLELDEAVRQKNKTLETDIKQTGEAIEALKELQEKTQCDLTRNRQQLFCALGKANSVITRAIMILYRAIENPLLFLHNSLAHSLMVTFARQSTHRDGMEDLHMGLILAATSGDIKEMSEAVQVSSSKRNEMNVTKIRNRYKGHISFYCSLFMVLNLCVLGIAFLTLSLIYMPCPLYAKEEPVNIISFVPFRMKEQFNCAEEKDAEVHSLCVSDDSVVVSYTQRGLRTDVASQRFTKTGQMMERHDNYIGKTFWFRIHETCVPSHFDTAIAFSKSETRSVLSKTSSEKAVIKKINTYDIIESGAVLKNSVLRLQINIQTFRNFDADSRGKVFAVVEEGKPPTLQRTVKVFKKPSSDPFGVYVPPNILSQPADVCFYKINNTDFLLVADEWNNQIHVVAVDVAGVHLKGFMKSGCPVSSAPTVLHVDDTGDLWVACKGGSVVKTSYHWFTTLFSVVTSQNFFVK